MKSIIGSKATQPHSLGGPVPPISMILNKDECQVSVTTEEPKD